MGCVYNVAQMGPVTGRGQVSWSLAIGTETGKDPQFSVGNSVPHGPTQPGPRPAQFNPEIL
jgi:hypothetical protein